MSQLVSAIAGKRGYVITVLDIDTPDCRRRLSAAMVLQAARLPGYCRFSAASKYGLNLSRALGASGAVVLLNWQSYSFNVLDMYLRRGDGTAISAPA